MRQALWKGQCVAGCVPEARFGTVTMLLEAAAGLGLEERMVCLWQGCRRGESSCGAAAVETAPGSVAGGIIQATHNAEAAVLLLQATLGSHAEAGFGLHKQLEARRGKRGRPGGARQP